MDINKHLYFVALGACKFRDSEFGLSGVDAHGGITSSHDRITNAVWLVDQSGQRRLAGKLRLVHQQRVGHFLTLYGQQISAFPCLLTTDSDMRWVFSGAVNVVANDNGFDLEDGFPASGIPLCGKNWFGLLRLIDRRYWLDAYSTGDDYLRDQLTAFNPDWTEGFDDHDSLIFTIENGIKHSPPTNAVVN